MYHTRKYVPINPQKYDGDPTNIFLRSSWEIKFATWCDRNPSVIKWKSEEVVIPYICPTDNRRHRYFVDFFIQVRSKDGSIKGWLIEIKPAAQTRPPEPPKKKTKRYIQEVMTWGKNEAKWKAADQYAKDRGWEFKIITEYELGLK